MPDVPMTLPWFLNPWAEARRLRDKNRLVKDAAIAERNTATGAAAICSNLAQINIREAFPTHPNFGEVIRMVPAEELERVQSENAGLRQRIAEVEKA